MDYNARFYSPRLGRFTQPDTIVPGMSSQAYNRYSYVNNESGARDHLVTSVANMFTGWIILDMKGVQNEQDYS